MVEYAVLLPFVLLIVLLPAFQVGRLMLARGELADVARQAAGVGARDDCDAARAVVPRLLNRSTAEAECDVDDDLTTVRVTESIGSMSPIVPLPSTVEVSGRAVTP